MEYEIDNKDNKWENNLNCANAKPEDVIMVIWSTMLELLAFLMVKWRGKNLRLNKVQYLKYILNKVRKKLTKLRNFTLLSVSLAFVTIVGGGGIY